MIRFWKSLIFGSLAGAALALPPTTVQARDWDDYRDNYRDAQRHYNHDLRRMYRNPNDYYDDYYRHGRRDVRRFGPGYVPPVAPVAPYGPVYRPHYGGGYYSWY